MSHSKLNRTTSSQRKALLRDLVTDMIIHERITTTEAKAKELRKITDKMITLAKENTLASRRRAAKTVRMKRIEGEDFNALQKLFDEIGPRYQDRTGGYTRIIKTVPRRGDGAPMAIIELV